jgi:hypothetical protein
MVRVETDSIEPIMTFALDSTGDPITGLTNVAIRIRRQSDNYYFDWSDDTFKAGASVVTLLQALSEVDAVRSPGVYELTGGWDLSDIVNPVVDDTYFVTAIQDGSPQSATNFPASGEIKEGQWVDDLVLAKKMLVNRLELANGDTDNWVLYDDDDATPLLTFDVTDKDGLALVLPATAPARRTRGE